MFKLTKKTHQSAGFTLIELLVAIAIIGILAAVLVANLVGARSRAKDASKKEAFNQLKSALRLYYNDNQAYPTSNATRIQVGGVNLAAGDVFDSADGNTMYMKSLPEYSYWKVNDESYTLRVQLENASDDSIETAYEKCCASRAGTFGCSADLATAQTNRHYFACED